MPHLGGVALLRAFNIPRAGADVKPVLVVGNSVFFLPARHARALIISQTDFLIGLAPKLFRVNSLTCATEHQAQRH